MDDSKTEVEKSSHDLNHQLGLSDDDIISKFSDDFSLKLLSPLVRLKRELHLSLPDLVPRPRDQENSGRPCKNGQYLDGLREENRVDTRHGMTNNDGLDLGQSNLHEETLEKPCNDNEPLQPRLNSNKGDKRTEDVADKKVVKIKGKRGRPPKNAKQVGGAVTESTSCSKRPHSKSTVFPPRKRGRPRKNGITGHCNAKKVLPTSVPISHLSGATKRQRNHPCKKSKVGFTAVKDQIVRNYPLRRLFHSTSRDKLVSRRFPGYAKVLGPVAQNSSAHSQKRNSRQCTAKASQRTVKDTQCVTSKWSEAKYISQDIKELKEELAESCRSKLCANPGHTAVSVEPRRNKPRTSAKETCEGVPSAISPAKGNLACMKEKGNSKKKSKSMFKLVRSHSVERLPSPPVCVDPSSKLKMWEPFSRCFGKHVSETSNVYDFTDTTDESLCVPTSPLTNKPQHKRGRPSKQKVGHAVGTKQILSRTGLPHRKHCMNKSEMIPSRNLNRLDIVHRKDEPQKKRSRGRPRKLRTNEFKSQEISKEGTHKLLHVQKPDRLYQENGYVRKDVEKEAEFTDLPLQQERLPGDKLPETVRNSTLFFVPNLVESGQQKKDVSLLHHTQPKPVRDDSHHMSSALWTPGWKDKPLSEYQGGSDQVTCLTPPGSNECLSTSGDEFLQTLEEPCIQKACQTPSNITTSSSSSAQDSVAKAITFSPSSNPGLPHFHQDATITDTSQDLFDRINSCSPFVLQVKSSDNSCGGEQNKSITNGGQENLQDLFMEATDNPIQESDGLSQIRIAKTFTLSKDELSSSCAESEDVDTHDNEASLITSLNDVPVKIIEAASSSLPRRERENIFQALRGSLNSQCSSLDRDFDQSGSNSSTQRDDWHPELMSVSYPEIPHLEAYGGGHSDYASHNSPHSGDSDTLPILEKEAFHDTCLDDDDDEFEFENPSDVALEFNKTSDDIPEQNYSHNWPDGSGPPQSKTDIIIGAEPVHHDLQNEAIGVAEDEDEFEFETPIESEATHAYELSSEEHPPESNITISGSLNSEQEYLHDEDSLMCTPKIGERQTEPEHRCDDEQFKNSFPILGISPNHLEYSTSLPSKSTSGNSSPRGGTEIQDCKLSQSNNLQNLSIPSSVENTKRLNENADAVQEFHRSQRALPKILSKDEQQNHIINIQNDQEKNSIVQNNDNISKQDDESNMPEDQMVQEMAQDESSVANDKVMKEIDTVEFEIEPGIGGRNEQSSEKNNSAECNGEKSDKPNNFQETSVEHSQSTPVDAGKAKDEAHHSSTDDAIGECQELLPLTDAEEIPISIVDRCPPDALNEKQSADSKICDVVNSEACKAPTLVHEGDAVRCGQDIAKDYSGAATDLQEYVRPSKIADFEVCTREKKVDDEVAEVAEKNLDKLGSNDSVGQVSPEEIVVEVHSPVTQHEETELQGERLGIDLHKVQEVMSDQCPMTIETSSKDIENETKCTSEDMEEELSDNVKVPPHSDANVKLASFPLSKTSREELHDTFVSKEGAGEDTSALSKIEDCSKVMELQEKKETLTTLSTSPDVKESCTISIDKTDGKTDRTKNNEQQKLGSDSTRRKNDNQLSNDLHSDPDMEHSQPAPLSTLQLSQMADAMQQSNPSKFNSDEHESQDHEKQESNNSLPCSPKEGDKVEDQSLDPQLSLQFALQEQETAKLDQSQKRLATEDLGQDCLTECGTADQTMRNESVSSHTHPNGLCESSANLTITSQDGSNSEDVISCSELPQASDKLIGLVEARKQTNPDDCVYLGVSTSDGTMDMLSVACEETIGGYDEDAMSTTSSGGATIAYPLSDGEDWNDQPEPNENNVIEGGLSSPVQDTPSLPVTGLHGNDVEHSSSLTACKWTVKFTKPKKRKRSRDRHRTKNKRKSNKKHKESRTKSKERQGKRHLKMTIVADTAAILESKSDDTAAELPEKHDFEQEEHPKSPLKEVAIDQEPIRAITHHPSIEKEIRGDLQKQKSPQETLLVSNSSCKLSIPKSPHCRITHIHESSPTEAPAQSEVMNPNSTDEKLADSNSDKRPSNGVCKGSELLNGSPVKVDVVTVSVEDPVVVDDNPSTPRTQSAGQESYDTSVSALLRNLVSQIQTSVSPGSLSTTKDATAVVGIQPTVPPSGHKVNHQREVSTMLHTAKSSAEKGDVCAKTVQNIPQDKATFFGTPRKDKTQIKPLLNIRNSAVPLHGSYYSAPVQQSTHFLPQQHVLPMVPLRHVYPKQSGACDELKQHLLRKQRLSAPDLQMLHQPQSQLAAPNQGYLTQQNTKLQNSVMHSSERDLALNQLAELRMQSQLERKRQNANAANRQNAPLTFHQVQMYPDSYFQSAQKDLPVRTNNNPSGAQSISNISGGLGHKESERLQFPGSRVSTAGTFSPPIADELPKMSTKLQAQILNKSEHSRVGYSISPAHHHVGYTADIPVYTATGPKEQLLAVYAPILQNEIPSSLTHQHARKSLPAAKQPRSNPGKRTKSLVDQDEMLNALRQLHGGGSATNSVRNVQVIRDQLRSQTSGIPLPETAHILENKRLNQIPIMIHQPSPTTNPVLHQPLNQPLQGVLSNVALTEIAEQRKNMVDPKDVLYHPHTVQGNQDNSLTGAAINFHNTALQSPTPRMLSRTPTPKSCTTSTAYASDNLTNLSHQPMSSELERVSLSRTSTPRSHCTPSTTPHLISDSTLPAQAEYPNSQLCQNNSTREEDMPLDLTCKVRTKVHVEQKLIAPLDLSCKQRICDAESQEQQAAQLNGEVFEENGIQDTVSRSRLEHSGSEVVKAYDEVQALGSQSHVQSEITHSSNSYASVETGQERSLEQADCISHQDMNISRQVLNTDMHGSELRRDGTSSESIKAANYILGSQHMMEKSSVQGQYAAREANVYIDRAGQPHAFSELLHHGLTSEGPGLKIAKTYNTYVNPPSTSASSIPFIDLTSLPKNILQNDGSAKSSVEVHHRQEQVPDETNAKTPTNSEDQQLHATHHLRRTRSDETKVRHDSSSSPTTNKASIVVGVERNKNLLDVSYIAPKNILRSVSTSNIAVASTESNLQVEDNQEQLKSKIQQNLQSMSDLSQCPKKRFKRAHEASMKQSDDVTLSKMPAVRTDSEVTKAAPSPHPSGSRKRGRPRGSKRTFEVSQPEAVVNQQCKFCEFETASRQEMKNHVNEIHFEKYRTKAASEKSNTITNNPGDRHDRDTGKRNRLSDEYRTSLTPEMGPNGSKVLTNTPSKDDMPDGIRTSELSQEISEMQQTGTDYCHHCDSYFPDTSSLAAHQRTHHQSEKYNFDCRLCNFSDSAPGPLVVHINKMHSKELKGGPCPFLNCSRKFSTVKEVKEHLNDHWIVKQYACKICSVRYQVFSSLKAHLDRHKQDLPNMCKVCTLSFKTPGTLLRHQKLKDHLPKP